MNDLLADQLPWWQLVERSACAIFADYGYQEFRIPLLGVPEYGLINFPYLPLTLSPFIDAGEAWSRGETPTLNINSAKFRTPVVSAGLSARVNLLGYAIIEAYWARPFQRPGKGWVYGLQLAPGW